MSDTWNDIVKDWEKIPIEAYQFLFNQAKERYEEIMSESESITNKAIKLTTVTIAAISGFVSYKFTAGPNPGFVVLLSFLFAADLICLGILLFPKKIIHRGSPPSETFIDYLDNMDIEEHEKTRLVYYHELKRYQKRMTTMDGRNGNRHIFYGIAMCLTILATVITAGVIISTIYHP